MTTMTDATLPPLRLWTTEVFSDDCAPYIRTTGARWTRKDAITAENVQRLIGNIILLKRRGLRIPPMPDGITVEFTPRQFARLLSCDLADAQEWVTLHLTPRLILVKPRTSPSRHRSTSRAHTVSRPVDD